MPQKLFGSRVFVGTPVGTYITAGDNVCSNPAGATSGCLTVINCVSADVDGGGVIGTGVRGMTTNYYLQLLNVSNISQTVTVNFQTTDMGYSVSSPAYGAGTPYPAIPVIVRPSATTSVTIPANSNTQVGFTLYCDSGSPNCAGTLSGLPFTYFNSKPGYACQSMYSTVKVNLTIAEDRGAIQAFMAAVPGRSHGSKDKMDAVHVQLNGGRPF